MKTTLTAGLLISAALWVVAAPALSATKVSKLESFNIKSEPAPADWRFFLKAPEASRESLWAHHAKLGHHLREWSWGWRLGWVRTCAKSARVYCNDVLKEALFDRAAVVRGEAAARIGTRYEGTKRPDVTALLLDAGKLPGNYRNRTPLYVMQRILFALSQVGGETALSGAATLANAHPTTKKYWSHVVRAQATE